MAQCLIRCCLACQSVSRFCNSLVPNCWGSCDQPQPWDSSTTRVFGCLAVWPSNRLHLHASAACRVHCPLSTVHCGQTADGRRQTADGRSHWSQAGIAFTTAPEDSEEMCGSIICSKFQSKSKGKTHSRIATCNWPDTRKSGGLLSFALCSFQLGTGTNLLDASWSGKFTF